MLNTNSNSSYFWPAILLFSLASIVLATLMWKSEKSSAENWLPQWQSGPHFKFARRALSAVANKTHLYVIGGIDNGGHYVREVEYAPILADGNLGPWKTTSSLSEGRFYLDSVIVNQYLFVLGGGTGSVGDENQPTSTVERARINADGSLGPFEIISRLKLPRRGLKAIVAGNRIYAIGGYSGVFLKSTEFATVQPDGSLSEWIIDPRESHLDRYIHAASYLNGRIYLLGGHVQNSPQLSYGDVESTVVSTVGSLGSWEIETSKLLTARFIASSFALGNKLYMLGGHNGGKRLNSVEFARVFNNGRVGNWSRTSALNTPRSAAATAVSDIYVYVVGGMGDTNALNSVEFATSSANGQLGYFTKN